jgi:hypothetical protein
LATTSSPQQTPPLVFQAGPPGVGKSTIGSQVSQAMGLRFLDLSPPGSSDTDQATPEARERLLAAVRDRSADLIALSWGLQQDKAVLALARRAGHLLLLWDHPLTLQARSGRAEPVCTPSGRLKTRGGFGAQGTSCLEFRRLDRACHEVWMLAGLPLDMIVKAVVDSRRELQQQGGLSPADQEGLASWGKTWREDYDANRRAVEIVLDAMARYTLNLKEQGASSRKLREVYTDLNAAGMLVMSYEAPKGRNKDKVLSSFSSPPWTIEYSSLLSGCPRHTGSPPRRYHSIYWRARGRRSERPRFPG